MSWRLADAAGETILQDFTTFRVEGDPLPGTTAPATQPFGVTTTTSPFISITPTQNSSSNPEPVNQGSNGGALWLGRLLSTIGILALFGGLALIAIGWPEGPEYVVTVRYLRAVWIMALLGTVLYLIAYAAKYHDSSFGAAMNPSDWLDLKDDGWPGRAALLRLGVRARLGLGGDAAGADHRSGDGDVGVGDPRRGAGRGRPQPRRRPAAVARRRHRVPARARVGGVVRRRGARRPCRARRARRGGPPARDPRLQPDVDQGDAARDRSPAWRR